MKTFQEFILECYCIMENVTSGRSRRAKIGGIQSKPTGLISNREILTSRQKEDEIHKSQIKSSGDKAHQSAVEKNLSPAEAEINRKRAEVRAERERIRSQKKQEKQKYKGVTHKVTKHNR